MVLKNVLLIVKDIERSRRFYQEVLGLMVTADLGRKVLFAGGIVLEESPPWEDSLEISAVYGGNDMELYFEALDVEAFRERLVASDFHMEFLGGWDEDENEVIRFYDPDRHVIEVKRAFC